MQHVLRARMACIQDVCMSPPLSVTAGMQFPRIVKTRNLNLTCIDMLIQYQHPAFRQLPMLAAHWRLVLLDQ